MPGPLPLLHVRDHAREAGRRRRGPVPGARRGRSTSARRGAALGCKEALFTLGDRPEDRWPEARDWLESPRLRLHARLPAGHGGPGARGDRAAAAPEPRRADLGGDPAAEAGRAVDGDDARDDVGHGSGPSPGSPHFGSPDKEPAVRLRVLEDAGRSSVPFTTGILVGIGETAAERVESLLAIRASARRHGHVQEVIVQNFRAKERTAMRAVPDVGVEEYVATVAVARLLLGPRMRAPGRRRTSPTPTELGLLLRAGVDDWGGVSPLTPDHVNPERPWPHLDDLARLTAEAGFTLVERLTAHPEYVLVARAVARPAGAPARRSAGRPGHRSRGRGTSPRGAAVAGAGPGLGERRRRPGRPARRGRHGGPHRRPAVGLRRRLRRLGRGRRAGGRRQPAPARTPAGGRSRRGRGAAEGPGPTQPASATTSTSRS